MAVQVVGVPGVDLVRNKPLAVQVEALQVVQVEARFLSVHIPL
jgi:hypothetical protein